jgi:hypothetical protein
MRLSQLLARRAETAFRAFPPDACTGLATCPRDSRPALRIYRQFIELCLVAEGVVAQRCHLGGAEPLLKLLLKAVSPLARLMNTQGISQEGTGNRHTKSCAAFLRWTATVDAHGTPIALARGDVPPRSRGRCNSWWMSPYSSVHRPEDDKQPEILLQFGLSEVRAYIPIRLLTLPRLRRSTEPSALVQELGCEATSEEIARYNDVLR